MGDGRVEMLFERVAQLERRLEVLERAPVGTNLPLISEISGDLISEIFDQKDLRDLRDPIVLIPCRDGSEVRLDTTSYRHRYGGGFDVDGHFVELLERITSKPSLAPASSASAKKWAEKTLESAVLKARGRALSAKLEAAEKAEAVELRKTPAPLFDASPLAERLRNLGVKEAPCPTSSASGDRDGGSQ